MSESQKKKILIDSDAGIDDASAILFAALSENVDILAISSVAGNATALDAALNILRTLKVLGKEKEIPVYRGPSMSLVGAPIQTGYHGSDGLGDSPDPDSPDETFITPGIAPMEIIRIVNKYPGEVELICLGPLTNIALALRLDPNIGKQLKNCYIMGGTTSGKGNVTAIAEYNFYCDPEAAKIVLKELPKITLITADACRRYAIPYEIYDSIRSRDNRVNRFLYSIEGQWRNKQFSKSSKTFTLCDLTAMIVALNNDLIQECASRYCTVELKGEDSRGALIIYHPEMNPVFEKEKCNITIVHELDFETYLKRLKHVFY